MIKNLKLFNYDKKSLRRSDGKRVAGVFTVFSADNGRLIYRLDEDVHERDLEAASETLRRQREKQIGNMHGSKGFASTPEIRERAITLEIKKTLGLWRSVGVSIIGAFVYALILTGLAFILKFFGIDLLNL